MVELSMRISGCEKVRVARVVKSNSPALPVGLEVTNPTFRDFLDILAEGPTPKAVEEEVPEEIEIPEEEVPALPTLEDLLNQAEEFGLSRADVTTAARYHFGVAELERLLPEQVDTLYERLMARYGAAAEVVELEMPSNGNASNGNGSNGKGPARQGRSRKTSA
jgi:hypothetical protein